MVSIINMALMQFAATLSDRYGRKAAIIPGLFFIVPTVAAMSLITHQSHAIVLLMLWSVGSTLLSSSVGAYVVDISSVSKTTPQALGMLRTAGTVCVLPGLTTLSGDPGIVCGSALFGFLAAAVSTSVSFGVAAALMCVVGLNLGFRTSEPSKSG